MSECTSAVVMPGRERLRDCAIDQQRGTAGEAHAFDFVRVFDHAAAGRDGRGRDEVKMRVGGANAFGEDEGHVLVEANGRGGEAAIC